MSTPQENILELTVREFLSEKIDSDPVDLINELAEETEYWENVSIFVDEKEYCTLDELTVKQRMWLLQIRDSLVKEDKTR